MSSLFDRINRLQDAGVDVPDWVIEFANAHSTQEQIAQALLKIKQLEARLNRT